MFVAGPKFQLGEAPKMHNSGDGPLLGFGPGPAGTHTHHAKWQRAIADRIPPVLIGQSSPVQEEDSTGFNFIGAAMFGEGGFWGGASSTLSTGETEKAKVPLYVGIRIYEVREINALEATFKAKVRIIATWHPPDLSTVADVLAKVPEGQTRCYITEEKDLSRFKDAANVPRELYFFNNLEGPSDDALTKDPPFVDMATGDVHWFIYGTTTGKHGFAALFSGNLVASGYTTRKDKVTHRGSLGARRSGGRGGIIIF